MTPVHVCRLCQSCQIMGETQQRAGVRRQRNKKVREAGEQGTGRGKL